MSPLGSRWETSTSPKYYGGKRLFKDRKIGSLHLQVPEAELKHKLWDVQTRTLSVTPSGPHKYKGILDGNKNVCLQ